MVRTCRLSLTQAVPAINLQTIKHLSHSKSLRSTELHIWLADKVTGKYYMPYAFKSMGIETLSIIKFPSVNTDGVK